MIGLALAGVAGAALFRSRAQEFAGILRQRHIAELHIGLARARETDDFKEARRLVGELVLALRRAARDSRARGQLRGLAHDIVDGRDLIDIAERTLVEPLDMRVRARDRERRQAGVGGDRAGAARDHRRRLRRGAGDQLIRRIAAIYGGRPGLLGFLKLLRSIGAHIAITGGMAAGDSLLQQFVGHGIAAKLSARLGEGVLNGLLTARVGLSAMAVCRPLPFATKRAPGVGDVAPFLFRSEKKE